MKKAQFLKTFIVHKNKWYRYAVWVLRDTIEAEDVVQELFLKLWERKDHLYKYNNLEALAFRMLKNLCIDRLRKIKTIQDSFYNHQPTQNQSNLSEKIELNDTLEIMEKIVAGLPETQRLVLQMKNIEGYSIKEIACLLKMETNAVYVNLSRARKKVKEQYTKWMNYGSKQD